MTTVNGVKRRLQGERHRAIAFKFIYFQPVANNLASSRDSLILNIETPEIIF